MVPLFRVFIVLALAGCGGPGVTGGDGAGGGAQVQENPGSASLGGDAGLGEAVIPTGWTPLVLRTFALSGGSEGYRCRRILVAEDQWIRGFRSLSPTGTHHTIVTISDIPTPLGDYDCGTGNLDPQVLYASGPSTPDLAFPAGVAMHLKKGQYLNLNLHVLNATNDTLTGEAGVIVETASANEVKIEADMTFVGRKSFTVPAGTDSYTVTGDCIVGADYQVFTVWPHMHRRGAYQKVTLTRAAASTTFYESLYTFDEQRTYQVPTATFHAGDQIGIECTYSNLTAVPAPSGPAATDEMCLVGMYRYPAQGGGAFDCLK